MIWLVFSEARESRWWAKYLEPGFRHVSILWLHHGTWILMRPLYGWVDMAAVPWRHGDIPQTVLDDDDLLIVPVRINATERLRSMVGLTTCVGWAKACMGIRAPWVWTPWQLYKHVKGRYSVHIPSTGDIHSGSEHQSETLPAG